MADLLSLSLILFFYFSLSSSQDLFLFVHAAESNNNLTVTPINYDLYHSSGSLMHEIKALVHRHPNKLSMETVKAGNKGYGAEIAVVTYCKGKRDSPEKPKLRILLMIPCLPEFWTAWKGADYLRTCFKDFVYS